MHASVKKLIEDFGKRSPDAARLALPASLAARVEPELLRALRLELFPEVEAGAEADLWFSPLVEASSPLGLVFRPSVLAELRRELATAARRALLEGAWQVLQRVHAGVPRTIRIEERVTYLSLKGAPPEEIDSELMPAVGALLGRNSEGAMRWARRVLPRLPEKAQGTVAAQVLDLKTARKLGKRLLPGNPSAEAVRYVYLLAPDDAEREQVGVRLLALQRASKWEFSHPPAAGSYVIETPKTDPIVVEMSWGEPVEGEPGQSRQVLVPLNDYATVADPGGEIKVRTGAGQSYLIKPPARTDAPAARTRTRPSSGPELRRVGASPVPGLTLRRGLRGRPGTRRVRRVAWSPEGPELAAPCDDKTVQVWDTGRGRRVTRLEMDAAPLCAAWSPDGRLLALGSEDNNVHLLDAAKWETMRVLRGHMNSVSCLAFSPSGEFLASGSYDTSLRVWDVETGELLQVFNEHEDWVRDLAWSPDGERVASCGDDHTVQVWRPDGAGSPLTLEGHLDWVHCLAWSPLGVLASGSDDNTIRVWDAETGSPRLLLEGHAGGVTRLSFSSDGRLLASKADDGTVRLWDARRWVPAAVIPESNGEESACLAFHPRLPLLVSSGEADRMLRVWECDVEVLLGASAAAEAASYTTAKIVIVGDSGVGKTGLGWRLAHGQFKEHASTHGQQMWVIDELRTKRTDGTECEAVLWDLAGQHAYRQVHSLFLEDVALALVLFDPTNRQEPLKGVQFWLEQLRSRGRLPPTVLVGARVDLSPPALSQQEFEQFCQRHGISGGYVSTSAKTGDGVEHLLEVMRAQIPWDEMTATVTTVTFKRIKDYMLSLKEKPDREGVLLSPPALREQLQATDPEWRFTDAEMLTAVRHLETHGYVAVLRSLVGESHILLTPELLVTLASSIVFLADKNPRELGAVSETELLRGEYPFDELKGLSPAESQVLLDAAILRFLQHNICLRETLGAEETLLIFPALIKQKRSLQDDLPATDDISYVVRGRVENLYASLVVMLGYTPSFTRINQWQNQAQYEMNEGEVCGFRLIEDREGEIELVLYYGDRMPAAGRANFQELFEQFLYQRDVEVTRFPPVVCPNGHRQERATVVKRVREGKRFVFCEDCGSKTDLPDFDRPQTIGIGASPWLQREEAAARLRSVYEVQLTRVKSYRRGWAAPRCYVSRLPDEAAWATKLVHDLRDAGVYVIEQAAQVQPDDFVVVLDTSAYQRVFAGPSLAADAALVRARLGGRQLISLTLTGKTGAHGFEQCSPGSFGDETHYPVSLFDLVLTLYAIPLTHAGFAPLRQSLHEQWEQTLARKLVKDETTPLKVFISYAHRDEEFKDELVTMLAVLQRRGVIDGWQDRRIEAGDEWNNSIQDAMNDCDLALLLVSPDYLASRFIQKGQQPTLLQRREEKGQRVIPIIVRPCTWQSEPALKDLQALPKDGKAVVMFSKNSGARDQVWADIATVIERQAKGGITS
jgi:small GTP-binding protein